MASRRVFLIGLSGSGKTVVAGFLGDRLGWRVLDTDSLIEEATGKTISELFEVGESHFREQEVRVLDEILAGNETEPLVVATGGGMPCIPGVMDLLLGHGIVVYLSASIDELWNRLTVDPADLQNRPLLRRGGRATLEKMLLTRHPIYRLASMTCDTDGLEAEEVVDSLVKSLGFLVNRV